MVLPNVRKDDLLTRQAGMIDMFKVHNVMSTCEQEDEKFCPDLIVRVHLAQRGDRVQAVAQPARGRPGGGGRRTRSQLRWGPGQDDRIHLPQGFNSHGEAEKAVGERQELFHL